jgi:RNA polymerase sigma-70 factor (ECF subfamily)
VRGKKSGGKAARARIPEKNPKEIQGKPRPTDLMLRTPTSPLTLGARNTDSGAVTQREERPCRDDRAAFVAGLVARHQAALMRHLRGLLVGAEAEDIFQETCRRLLEVPQLDGSEAKARGYMFRIATHLAYDRFRGRRTESLEAAGHKDSLHDVTAQPEVIVGFAQGCEIVRDTLLRLPARRRQVFLLRIVEGLRYESIAEILGTSKRTVEREMRHALDACQRRLQR